jgi:transposase InsO family protein
VIVIVKVDEPTEWVNSMVVTLKPNGKIRLCLDPRDLNRAIQREHYAMPTLDAVTDNLANQEVFTVCDAKSGYWHVPLDHESSLLTTFNTPWGRYRYTRMPFGIKSAGEVFQKRLDEVLEGLEGVYNIVDDILVTGSSVEEHDRHLVAMLDRMREKGVKLNPDKLQLRQTEVKFFGEILSVKGMKPDPSKVEAVRNMPPPTSKKELECDLGMFTYLAQYAPHLSDMTTALRELLKNDVEWQWCPELDRDFEAIKELITREPGPVLRYYDSREPVVLQVDASQAGMGAVLLQDGKPVAYASRALTPTQERYAQIEKEMLAIVFGCERFHQYLYGREFVVESDHKPLESVMTKPLHAVPLRLQKMRLRLQWYNPTVKWVPGKQIPVADALSRRYAANTGTTMSDDVDAHVHMIISHMPVTTDKMEQIRQETRKDQDLQILARVILGGWPAKQTKLPVPAREHWNHRDELSVIEDIIYKGEQIVIPKVLRHEMLEKIHVGHQGMEKSKQRARELLFWPGMYRDIEEIVAMCDVCLEHRDAQRKEPMIAHPIPERPWQVVATDLFQWNNQQYVLVVDYLSRYFEIALLSSTTAISVITHLKSIFAKHGIPEKVISDNGPQYSAEQFSQFAKEWGFQHSTSSPKYPQSNGLAEKTVQTVKGLLTKAKQSGQDPYLAMLNYRTTPVDGVASPAQILMSRRLRTTLPATGRQLSPQLVSDKLVRQKRELCQDRQKYYYDKAAKHLPQLNEGESVRVQKDGVWKPATVVNNADTPRSYWVRTQDGASYRRNSNHLLRTREPPAGPPPVIPQAYTPPVIATTPAQTSSQQKTPSPPRATKSDTTTQPVSPVRQSPVLRAADTPTGQVVTRSGRVVKPKTFPDFVQT